MLDPVKLRTVALIAELGSIAAAAERSGITPSAASQHVSALEAALETPLLERLPRSTRLTPAGHALAQASLPILAELDAAARRVREVAGLRAGALVVGTFASAVPGVLVPALRAFTARHAGVEITVTEIEPERALPQVRDGRLDVALVHRYSVGPREDAPGLARRRLFTEPLLLAVPSTHPAARRGQMALDEAADEPWITTLPDEGFQAVLEHASRRAGFTPHIRHRIDSYEVVPDLVGAGLGVALVPALAAHATPGVAYLSPTGRELSRIVDVVFRRTDPTPAVASFVSDLVARGRRVGGRA